MDQPGVDVRPLKQMTGTSEFNEVFFTDARTAAGNVVGEVNGGWKVAMGTLALERGVSTLGQQLQFANEFAEIVATGRAKARWSDPLLRQRVANVWMRLHLMRVNALRTLAGADGAVLPPAALISKLFWSTLHRDMGELAMDVVGPDGEVIASDGLTALQRLFLFSRADTIYAGTSEIQRNIIGERALGLPREP
jgi:alkylation response protein AidB-like acyl-CoA dehydrogenase